MPASELPDARDVRLHTHFVFLLCLDAFSLSTQEELASILVISFIGRRVCQLFW